MKLITLATMVLVSIGTIFGLLVLYGDLTGDNKISNEKIISKDQAVAIVLNYSHLTQQDLGNDTIEAQLLQAHLSNRIAFVIDPATLSAGTYPQVVPLPGTDVTENQLFWQIRIKTPLGGDQYHEQIFFVDAKNGTLLSGPT